jgi:dephospho-CoA kinase
MARDAVVGVTGKYCAGKSTVSAALDARGFEELDADALAHIALDELHEEVAVVFGRQMVRADGSVDRKALGRLVFGDRGGRRRLEDMLHPAVVEMVEHAVAGRSGAVVINAVFLVRAGFHRLCDVVFWVSAPWWVRLGRGLRRDGFSVRAVLRVMRAQNGLRRRTALAQHPRVVTIRTRRGQAAMERQLGRALAAVWRPRE